MTNRLFLSLCAGLLLTACATQPAETPAATPVSYGERIELPAPPPTGGLTIDEALWRRCSSRDFTAAAELSLEELSGVLWAAAGVNRPEDAHLTAPSALALYPVRVYAFLPGGVYRYDAAAHTLTRVIEGDRRAVTGQQPFVAAAALNIVYVADLSVYERHPQIPAEQVRYLCGQDAAGYAENANLYAAGHGLKAVTRGSFSEELLPTLGLDPGRCVVALAQSIGK